MGRFLLKDKRMGELALMVEGAGDKYFHAMVLLASVFLLRVQTEAVPVQAGCPSEQA